MRQRKHYWEHTASPLDITNKLLEIIYMSEYAVWHELFLRGRLINNKFTYTDIIDAYYDLTPNNKLKFYNYCYTIGIYSTFMNILGEHLSQ